MITTGWAVVVDGEIDLVTIARSLIGSKRLWLEFRKAIPIMNSHSDDVIEAIWEKFRGTATVVEVSIAVKP